MISWLGLLDLGLGSVLVVAEHVTRVLWHGRCDVGTYSRDLNEHFWWDRIAIEEYRL